MLKILKGVSALKTLCEALKLYLVTDRHWEGEMSLEEQTKEAILGGVTFIQYREKHLSYAENLERASKIQQIAATYEAPFVINDDVELAIELNADGVHVGQSDLNASVTRSKIGQGKLLGVSVSSVEEALTAVASGADYLGVGAIFETGSKQDAKPVSLETLKAICEAVPVPVVAIGGIHVGNLSQLKDTGICGVAVISAILASNDPKRASEALREVLL